MESFDEASETDKEFEGKKDENIVEAYNYSIKQEWFKKWATDNEVEAPEAWLKDSLRVMTGFMRAQLPMMEEQLAGLAEYEEMLEMAKEANPEAYKEGMAKIEEAKKEIGGIIEAIKQIPEVSEDETKLLEDNAEALAAAMEDDDEDSDDGEDHEDGDDDDDGEDDMG
ncbi:MAG: hypothetical protein ACYTDT_03340 [Planctomycetota bacterium]|jgi:hypothetical protein